MMDQMLAAQQQAKTRLYKTGKGYAEILQFKKVPGVGPVGAHLASAIIQTPHRFATASSYERLDRNGRSEIKEISYRAWERGHASQHDNEVKAFYQASVARTRNPTHARLNTQHKILNVLLAIWRNK